MDMSMNRISRKQDIFPCVRSLGMNLTRVSLGQELPSQELGSSFVVSIRHKYSSVENPRMKSTHLKALVWLGRILGAS